MDNFPEIADKIVNDFLKIKPGNIVSISGEIHNANKTDKPLLEIPFIEELALGIRKKKAFPVLEISTENLKKRFFAEMPSEIFSLQPVYYKKWIDSIDVFIYVGWKNVFNEFQKTSNEKLKESLKSIWEKIFQQKKKLLFLNFPSSELAEFLKTNFDDLMKFYSKSVDCNYAQLQKAKDELKSKFSTFSNYTIHSKNEKLNIKTRIVLPDLSRNKDYSQISILPFGNQDIPLERKKINGTFIAEKAYYKNFIFENLKINFEKGFVHYISFEKERKENFILQNALMKSKTECFLVLGFNPKATSYTNYYLFDTCIDGNTSMKFFDGGSHPIILSNINAEIKKKI
ncbi:MAG: hypothetical protein HQ534_13545 [Armatimonadetes bacterium]|nr:hypothetical protein [Armatimonadota bacterium]